MRRQHQRAVGLAEGQRMSPAEEPGKAATEAAKKPLRVCAAEGRWSTAAAGFAAPREPAPKKSWCLFRPL